MGTEDPPIPEVAQRRAKRNLGHFVCRVIIGFRRPLERRDPQVDLAHLETGDFDVEIETEQRELFELRAQQAVVPGRDFGQSVIGNPEGADLRRGEVIEAKGRNYAPAELAAGQQPAMPGDYVVFSVDQNRNIEAEFGDAVRNLTDLFFCVAARVGGVRFQLINAPVNDVQARTRLGLGF